MDSGLNHEYLGSLLIYFLPQYELAEEAFSGLPIRPVHTGLVHIPFATRPASDEGDKKPGAIGPSHCEAALRMSLRLLHFAQRAETDSPESWTAEQMALLGGCLPIERRSEACAILSDNVSIELRTTFRVALDLNASVQTKTGSLPSHYNSDDPFVEGEFRWKGRGYKIEGLPLRLLKYMWNRKSANAVVAHQYALEDPLKPSTDNGIKAALRRINSVLNSANCPKCLSKDGETLLWNE